MECLCVFSYCADVGDRSIAVGCEDIKDDAAMASALKFGSDLGHVDVE